MIEKTTHILAFVLPTIFATGGGIMPAATLCRSHSAMASSDTLPCPKERCSHTWRIPRSAHSRTTFAAMSG